MAKIYGLFGSMKGKVGDVVMSVRNGNQIVRKYQPMVYNPSTQGQVAARAKLKLISQLSAQMGSVIAMPRVGIVSPRNLFTKVNYPLVSFVNSTDPQKAQVELSAIKLTKSNVFLPPVQVTLEENIATTQLSENADDLDRVIYCFFIVTPSNGLRLASAQIVTTGPTFQKRGPINLEEKYVVYAYGIRLNSDTARAKFAEITTDDATLVASLVSSRVLNENDITLTETQFAVMNP